MSRIRGTFAGRGVDHEFDEEVQAHLDLLTARFMNQGMTADEAKYAARRQFGGIARLKEDRRERLGISQFEVLFQDLRSGMRLFAKNPGFSAAAVLTMALGIGANVAIYSVAHSTLMRPLPWKDPGKIVLMWGITPQGYGWRGRIGFSAPNFFDFKERNRVFESIATFERAGFTLTGVADPHQLQAGRITADFFKVLGIQPILGRTFLPEEEQDGQNHVALLSYKMWQRQYRADRNIVGQTIRLDEVPYTVAGVLPDLDFSIPDYIRPRDLWVPATLPRENARRTHFYLNVIARIKPESTLRGAQQDVDTITARLAREYPKAMAGLRMKLITLHDQMVEDIRPLLLILFGAVGFVLLIACANVANLQLARSSTRRKEMAVRTALGASRGRIARQLLTESMLLALAGGAVGVAFASWGIDLLAKLGSAGVLHENSAIAVDSNVFMYSLVLSLITGIAFGLAPALQFSTPGSLREGGGSRLRGLLTISEVAFSVVLLIGAALLTRSFVSLLQVKPGYEIKNILTLRISLPRYAYRDSAKKITFYKEAMERIRTLPGVKSAGAINDLPLTHDADSDGFSIEHHAPANPSDERPSAHDRMATPGYFSVMGIPLLAGRALSEGDTSTAPAVVLINQSLARRFFPNEDPIGKRLKFGPPASSLPWATIVGVVGDIRDTALDTQPAMEIYAPYQQNTLPYNPLSGLTLVVRTSGDPASLAQAVASTARGLDKELPLQPAMTMEAVLAESISKRRFLTLLLAAFASIAIVLAGVGVYGVISYSVAKRTRQIGIRIALGARPHQILQLILGQGLTLTLIGVVTGLAGALALTRVLSTMLYRVSATDAATFGGIALLVVAVALLASYIPARRAARVDPMVALRCE